MVDIMAVLGAAASAKLTGDRLVRDFVAYIRERRRASAEPTQKLSRHRRKKHRLSRSLKPSTSGLGPRPSSRRSKKLSLMTDAELEAELETRRRRRAKERDLYSRAVRSEKLAALESELTNLRREIGRFDPVSSRGASRGGTPHSVRFESLPPSRRSIDGRSALLSERNHLSISGPVGSPPPLAGPPPPPPPPPPPGGDGDDGITMDPEQRRREKEERQKRREAKKKEREQSQKKMTLADIIKSAGPDPMKRLKRAGKKPADTEREEHERQKREREEREMRQEQERIEQEKRTIEGMGRRVAEQQETKSHSSDDAEDANDTQGSSENCSSDAKKAKSENMEQGKKPASKQESAETVPSESDDNSNKVQGDEVGLRADSTELQAVASKDEDDAQDSSSEGLKKSDGETMDSQISATVGGDVAQKSDIEKKLDVSDKAASKVNSKNDKETLDIERKREVRQPDAENIPPNTSTANDISEQKTEGKTPEKVDQSINHPRIL